MEIATDDSMEDGYHQLLINSVELHGKWLSDYQIVSLILIFWVLAAFYYLAFWFWQIRDTLQLIRLQKNQLGEVNAAL